MQFTKHTLFLAFLFVFLTVDSQNSLGEGFFSPNVNEIETLFLYDIPSENGLTGIETPVDSITFSKRNGFAVGITYAPENFLPFHEKLDYGLFIVKVKRLGRDYTEIVINEHTGATRYVHNFNGTLLTWGAFLLNCHSVEFINPNQQVYEQPTTQGPGKLVQPAYLQPRYIMGDWMEVALLNSDYNRMVGKGWIRWKKEGKLLINYNLFS